MNDTFIYKGVASKHQYCVILTLYPSDSIDKNLILRCKNSILERFQKTLTNLLIDFVGQER